MKICCAQIMQVWDDADEAFVRAGRFAESCDADMIVFPEQYAGGWRACLPGISDVSVISDAQDASDVSRISIISAAADAGAVIKERWISLSRGCGKCIAGSYMKRSEDGRGLENTMLVCAPDGNVLAEYSKIHLFSIGGEDKCFLPGRRPVTFEYGGLRFGCAVCFDLRFPELFREYMRLRCHAVLLQAAWPAARASDWELLIRARALENRMYVLGCNCIGFDDVSGTDYCGRSVVCDYNGKIADDAGVFEGGCCFDAECEDVCGEVDAMRGKWGVV